LWIIIATLTPRILQRIEALKTSLRFGSMVPISNGVLCAVHKKVLKKFGRFLDNIDGMEAQIKCLANEGALASFVGMLTDSGSLLSYSHHEYFRRSLCNIIGSWVEDEMFINDEKILKKLVQNICAHNAERFFM